MKKTIEEQLLEEIEPTEFFEFMGWRMRRDSTAYRGPCPAHGGKDDNFAYVKKGGYFYCHSHCKWLGNFIKIYATVKNISYEQALVELAKWKGISLSGRRISPKPLILPDKKVVADTPVNLKKLPLVNEKEKQGLIPLTEHPRFSPQAIKRFHIQRGIAGRYKNRIVFPIWDANGRWVGNNARWDGEDYEVQNVPKYLHSGPPFETRYTLYGYHFAQDAPFWILHEGVSDTIQAFDYGYETVSVLGSSLTLEQIELLRKKPKPIVLGFDGDEAGRKATKRAIELLFEKHLTNVSVMQFPEGRDPGNVSKDEYEQLFLTKIPAITFLYQAKTQE